MKHDWEIIPREKLELVVVKGMTVRFLLMIMRNFFEDHVLAYRLIAQRLLFTHKWNCSSCSRINKKIKWALSRQTIGTPEQIEKQFNKIKNLNTKLDKCKNFDIQFYTQNAFSNNFGILELYCELSVKFLYSKEKLGIEVLENIITQGIYNDYHLVGDGHLNPRKPTLDEIERKIDWDGQYQGRFGKHVH